MCMIQRQEVDRNKAISWHYWLNLAAASAGGLTIVLLLFLEHTPSKIGWLFVTLGGVAVASGILGAYSSHRRCCFAGHVVLLLFTIFSLLAAFAAGFFRPLILKSLHYEHIMNYHDAWWLLSFLMCFIFTALYINLFVAWLGICILGRTHFEVDKRVHDTNERV